MSQRAVAKECGIDVNTYRRLEKGKYLINAYARVATYLGVHIPSIFKPEE